eukprot:6375812-Alexandrium_andersonii.AAC.1
MRRPPQHCALRVPTAVRSASPPSRTAPSSVCTFHPWATAYGSAVSLFAESSRRSLARVRDSPSIDSGVP